jgi:hypothetical protein
MAMLIHDVGRQPTIADSRSEAASPMSNVIAYVHDDLVAFTDRVRGITTNIGDWNTPSQHDDNAGTMIYCEVVPRFA